MNGYVESRLLLVAFFFTQPPQSFLHFPAKNLEKSALANSFEIANLCFFLKASI